MRLKKLPMAELLGFEASDKRIDILRRIATAGSISEAARSAGVSYKAAWQALETLANLAGTPLVDTAVGGTGGGGATLTSAGLRVLEAANALAKVRALVLSQLDAYDDTSPARAALALRTSMRNQFPCTIGQQKTQQGQKRIGLLLPDGLTLHARITRESAELLNLSTGLPVLALFKATAVEVAEKCPPRAGRNVMKGVVTRSSRSAQGGEVSLRLPGGIHLVGFSRAAAGLKVGQTAVAAFDESSVVIASTD